MIERLPDQTLSIHTERNSADPRIVHELTLRVDAWGNVVRSASVAYGRQTPGDAEQTRTHITCTDRVLENQVAATGPRRIGLLIAETSYEIGGVTSPLLADPAALDAAIDNCLEIPFHQDITGATPERRVLAASLQTYLSDDLTTELPRHQVGTRAIPARSYQQTFADNQITALYDDRIGANALRAAGYVEVDNEPGWWSPSGTQILDPNHFYLPTAAVDPFGAISRIEYDERYLVPVRVEDPVGNVATAELDYRVLQSSAVTDANGNRSVVQFDEVGLVIATVVQGKNGEGDTAEAPTSWLEYDLTAVPVVFRTYAREEHRGTRIQESRTYGDGTGRIILTKVQAEPGDDDAPRWVGTGRTIHDNKGQPVKRYEPYFAPTADFDTESELIHSGVTPVLRYDPLGRNVRTDQPDGTYGKIVIGAWDQQDWDAGDTVTDSRWYIEHTGSREAELSAAYARTFTTTRLDALGRSYLTLADNKTDILRTSLELDVQGNERSTTDARGNEVLTQRFDMLGRASTSRMPDSTTGQPMPP